jgi:predicted ribosomally synthesized peptide with SipW-like signal peptide
MKAKRKVLVVALAIALIAIAVGGSLAWFTDNDEVKNVFTVGNVDIEQWEEFVQDSQLIPVVGNDPTVATDNYIKKNVTVKSIGDNPAYVQTFIAVPKTLDDKGIVKLYQGDADKWGTLEEVAVDVTMPGETMKYDIYRCRYTVALNKGDVTDACLEYVYIDKAVDINTYDTNNDQVIDKAHLVAADGTEVTEFDTVTQKLNIYVATQGVQSQGFADFNAALNSAFANHPWAQ